MYSHSEQYVTRFQILHVIENPYLLSTTDNILNSDLSCQGEKINASLEELWIFAVDKKNGL